MKKWLKSIRGALGKGLTLAEAWAGVGAILAVLPWVSPVGGPSVLELVVGFGAQYAAMGFVGGAAFSVVLGMTESRRRFDQMSLPRFAAWGALGGLFMSVFKDTIGYFLLGLLGTVGVPGITVTNVISAGIVTLMAAGSAAGSLALARRADPLLKAGESDGLIEGENTPADSAPAEGAADIGADFDDIGLTKEEKRELLAE